VPAVNGRMTPSSVIYRNERGGGIYLGGSLP
jgi:hypothetical protein